MNCAGEAAKAFLICPISVGPVPDVHRIGSIAPGHPCPVLTSLRVLALVH